MIRYSDEVTLVYSATNTYVTILWLSKDKSYKTHDNVSQQRKETFTLIYNLQSNGSKTNHGIPGAGLWSILIFFGDRCISTYSKGRFKSTSLKWMSTSRISCISLTVKGVGIILEDGGETEWDSAAAVDFDVEALRAFFWVDPLGTESWT